MKPLNLLMAAAFVTSIAFNAHAAAKTAEQATDGKVSAKTEMFIKNANIGNMFEVDSSKLALDRSEDKEVRAFATKMIQDHQKAAKTMKSALPMDADPSLGVVLDAKHEAKLDKLRNTPDHKFDAAYLAAQKEAHAEAVALFSGYAKNGDEPSLRDFAARTLPTLKSHQNHVLSFKKGAEGYAAKHPEGTSASVTSTLPGARHTGVERSSDQH